MQKGGQRGYKNERDQRLLPHLVLTDPREDKKITVDAKGGLLKDSHQWILDNSDFKKWLHDKGCRLLWIQGGPGRGKTMLLCGIIDELSETPNLLSFFLCQGSNPDQNSAAAVLRGLIHVLISRQPALTRHIDEEHGEAVQELFEDSKAFPKLAQIFTRMLEDSLASTCYLVIDGLNECIADLGLLLDFIANRTADSPAKWIVSSRNWPRIAEAFDLGDAALTISLEVVDRDFQHNTMVFINRSMEQLTMLRDLETAEAEACAEMIRHELRTKANGTLLWVAVVVQQLQNTEYWNLQSVKKFFDNTPSDLQSLYEKGMQDIRKHESSKLCTAILSVVTVAFRALTLNEIGSLIGSHNNHVFSHIQNAVETCDCFLTVTDGSVYFVHHSAREYLLHTTMADSLQESHRRTHLISLEAMNNTLRRDIYGLKAAFSPVPERNPYPDPLAPIRYPCLNWVNHLVHGVSSPEDFTDDSIIHRFLKSHVLHWLEALSLMKSFPNGMEALSKLLPLIPVSISPKVLDQQYSIESDLLYQ
ncbi:Vegetative incompatibility protein HET-E-1 [Colletotrichum siamense]|nr:Vegetative incompatibility protein HET-E-1 [Colletotrichum siamense]